MNEQFETKRFCYFAVDKLCDYQFIGFIGLSMQAFYSDFTPCIDIGWRIKPEDWNKGHASEGALRCFQYGFSDLDISTIYAVAPKANRRSISVMRKIGMIKEREFYHPSLDNIETLKRCVLYSIIKFVNTRFDL